MYEFETQNEEGKVVNNQNKVTDRCTLTIKDGVNTSTS
jgi:hypothetical protein